MTKCMQCDKESEDLFWVNDFYGTTFKKVCSHECMNKAIEELEKAWNNILNAED